MTERKFTDEEVIRALECCIIGIGAICQCKECPLWYATEKYSQCKRMLVNITSDLINRQRADYLRLEKAYIKNQEIFADQCLENERLKAELGDLREIVFTDRTEAVKNLKAEAIKEFAERVIDLIYEADDVAPLTEWQIRDLVKEMTEGKPCTEDADCSTCENCYHDGGYNECATDGWK